MELKISNLAKKHKRKAPYTMETKIQVVSQYLVLGNMALVAATTNIPHQQIRLWKTQPWWKEVEQQIRSTENIQTDSKMSRIIDKSFDAIEDRLDKGDFIYDNKTGQIKRKPVNMKDAARVAIDLVTKRELLRGNATERKETTQVSMQEQLKQLAAEFAKLQKPKSMEVINVTDVEIKEDTDAVYDEREEGLQTGVPEVRLISDEEEEACDLEQESETLRESGFSPQG